MINGLINNIFLLKYLVFGFKLFNSGWESMCVVSFLKCILSYEFLINVKLVWVMDYFLGV